MKITVKGIEIQAVIGTQDHERNNPQRIFVDIEFDYDSGMASRTDKLEYAADYSKIVAEIISSAKKNRYYLLETLAEKVVSILKDHSVIRSGKVTVKKPSAIKNIEYVSAEMNF